MDKSFLANSSAAPREHAAPSLFIETSICFMEFAADVTNTLASRLNRLYSGQAEQWLPRLLEVMAACQASATSSDADEKSPWSEKDCVLITYGDQVRREGASPLAVLREFLVGRGLDQLINTVHLLPFFPYSSDDGFSVIDFGQVDPDVGSWEDVAALRAHFDLMFDLVLNHISRESAWFQNYLAGVAPHDEFFVEADPRSDLSRVTRPRSLPLLTPVQTTRGTRHVWTTFSADQIDLNYGNPVVLLRMVEVLLDYAARGARIIRLDAIAYLWKRLGTTCIHLSETHEVVKLFRDVLRAVAPHVLLLTETNVPHDENTSYFGDGDEAHMVYQFSLPPLLLDALVQQDATWLNRWLEGLQPPRPGTTFFNFTASHDGVGVRPLEGLAPPERLDALVAWVKQRGGLVSTRRQPDGTDSPYELNISYVDALGTPDGDVEAQARRFLASQAVMLALRGVPGIYFHSLVGTRNDQRGVQESGHARRINRRKFPLHDLDNALDQTSSLQHRIHAGYRHLLRQRINEPAFHPDAGQQFVNVNHQAIVTFLRQTASHRVLVVANVSAVDVVLPWSSLPGDAWRYDLIGDGPVDQADRLTLEPFQVMWLTETR